MTRVNFVDIVRCAVCGRCRSPEDFPAGVCMCWPCHVTEVIWHSAWFLSADELGVPVPAQEGFVARQNLMIRMLLDYFRRINFPVTRFGFEGELFEVDFSSRYGFRSKARGFDTQFISSRPVPPDAEQRLRLWFRETLTKVIKGVEALDDDLVEDMGPLDAGIMFFTEVSDYMELLYHAGTLYDDDDLQDHLHEIIGVICDSQ